jgi:hypothetical protein
MHMLCLNSVLNTCTEQTLTCWVATTAAKSASQSLSARCCSAEAAAAAWGKQAGRAGARAVSEPCHVRCAPWRVVCHARYGLRPPPAPAPTHVFHSLDATVLHLVQRDAAGRRGGKAATQRTGNVRVASWGGEVDTGGWATHACATRAAAHLSTPRLLLSLSLLSFSFFHFLFLSCRSAPQPLQRGEEGVQLRLAATRAQPQHALHLQRSRPCCRAKPPTRLSLPQHRKAEQEQRGRRAAAS